MQYSLISGYFHDFTEEHTMMLKVLPDDDLGSTAHDHKKEQEKGIHMTPIVMMSSISMLALPECGNVFGGAQLSGPVSIELREEEYTPSEGIIMSCDGASPKDFISVTHWKGGVSFINSPCAFPAIYFALSAIYFPLLRPRFCSFCPPRVNFGFHHVRSVYLEVKR
ncbi:hypothetical protein BHE74_00050914 [Ensete ventricosum]|nr:hypothetical protein BHE74_00050914 [Ensete ventricosum]